MNTTKVLTCVSLALAAVAARAEGPTDAPPSDKLIRSRDAVAGRYIVVLRAPEGSAGGAPARAAAAAKAAEYGVEPDHTYVHALRGFAFKGSEADARALAADAAVAYVVEDGVVRAVGSQPGAEWGLRRIDQRLLPTDANYDYDRVGKGVHAYVIDTGIRATHQDFGGRASGDFSAIADGRGADDCHGHGTHVAGTLGGNQWGVAKRVRLHAVRVLDCNGNGTASGVIAGVDWVTGNHVKPAVANMSLGGGANPALDQAVRSSIAAGVTYVVAAGNNPANDACGFSPARVAEAITVAATDAADRRAWFSKFGGCVDVFAPGVDVRSTSNGGDAATAVMSGTSMASPHVAGVAALALDRFAGASPAQIQQAIIAAATPNIVVDPGPGSPNRLLWAGFAHEGEHYLTGDWDGDGRRNLAVRRGNCVLMDVNFDGLHDIAQCYGLGAGEDEYLVGDWDGDGRDNLAVRRGNCVLMDVNFDGLHDIAQCYGFGWGEDEYLVGDWNGDRRSNLAVRRGNCVLMDVNFDGLHDIAQCYGFGAAEDQYLAGDWEGDRRSNLAVRRGNCVLMDVNFDGLHDIQQCYGLGN